MLSLKLIALDLDGPLLADTFAPILRLTCEHYGWEYTREFERNTLSRPRAQATQYVLQQFTDGLPADLSGKSQDEMIRSYFQFREEYLKENPLTLQPGAADFLRRMATLDVTLVCYGGLDEAYMRQELGDLADLFDRYVCTNDFRPGVREIVHDIYGVRPEQALFVDDVNYVAEYARDLGVPFIGVPSSAPWSWQRQDMEATGVPFIVSSVAQIDGTMLAEADKLAASGAFWRMVA